MPCERYEGGGGPGYAGQALRVGLCAGCAHAAVQRSAKGSAFWRCRRADDDATLLRYPPLPVRACHAFARGTPAEPGAAGAA